MENYTLLKAAEVTKAARGTHFSLVSAGNHASAGLSSMTGGTDFGAYVRVITLEPGSEVPQGLLSADEVIHFFGPRYGRGPVDG